MPMPKHYRDMVDWSNKKNLTENPATQHISNDDLFKIGTGEKNLTEFIPKVMSHSIGKKPGLYSHILFFIFLF